MPENTRDTARGVLAAKYPQPSKLDRVATLAANLAHLAPDRICSLLDLTPAELRQVRERPLYRDESKRLAAQEEKK